jgi:transcriptional regulator with XRE-family HTH domain
MSTKKSQLNKTVADLRAALKESQQQFSNRLGVALGTIARWETGDRSPSAYHLKKMAFLAQEHNLPLLYIAFETEYMNREGTKLGLGEIALLRDQLVYFRGTIQFKPVYQPTEKAAAAAAAITKLITDLEGQLDVLSEELKPEQPEEE